MMLPINYAHVCMQGVLCEYTLLVDHSEAAKPFLLKIYYMYVIASILEFICYDDGCHLRKYATNSSRCDLTATTTLLSQVEIVIDKLHFAGHGAKQLVTHTFSVTGKRYVLPCILGHKKLIPVSGPHPRLWYAGRVHGSNLLASRASLSPHPLQDQSIDAGNEMTEWLCACELKTQG